MVIGVVLLMIQRITFRRFTDFRTDEQPSYQIVEIVKLVKLVNRHHHHRCRHHHYHHNHHHHHIPDVWEGTERLLSNMDQWNRIT
jgi:ABC-type nickel/cobalt efflux system permease component RcnA